MSSRSRTYRPWQSLLLRIVIVASLSKGIRAHFVSAWSSAITVANNIWHKTAEINRTVLETVIQRKIHSHDLLIKTTQPIPSYTEFSHCFVDQHGLLVSKRSSGSCNLNQYQSFFFFNVTLLNRLCNQNQIRTWEYFKVKTSVAS